MILRPRQKEFVEKCLAALKTHGNTLGVAPTGAGKTIMLSSVVGQILQSSHKRACILAHRDELTAQNQQKFLKVNPHCNTSIFDASEKSWHGEVTFAMVQTLSKTAHLEQMPKLDVLVIDEAHHVAAASYQRVITHAKTCNTHLQIFGVTATPNRGDKQGLRAAFSNVADQITVSELIASGHLVPPKTYVVDVGTQSDLQKIERNAQDFDMEAVAHIMNRPDVNEAVFNHWHEKAHTRKTVIFCSTIAHAMAVHQYFSTQGVDAVLIHGKLSKQARQEALFRYEQGKTQVIVNVAVLTEGWDYPPTSCIILLRPSSFKSTMVQMIGRGLRIVDASLHPGVQKTDCIVLDFGTSTLLHGSLEDTTLLDGAKSSNNAAPQKSCPACEASLPIAVMECPLCGFVFESENKEEQPALSVNPITMREIDLMQKSSFLWEDIFADGHAFIAVGFHAWGGVFSNGNYWFAIGGKPQSTPVILSVGEKITCLASANDWLNDNESDNSAHKTRRWLQQPATDKQLAHLPIHYRHDFGLTRYRASGLLTFYFNKAAIRSLIVGGGP